MNGFSLAAARLRPAFLGGLVAILATIGCADALAAGKKPTKKPAPSTPSFYVLANAKGSCRTHYSKQKVSIRVRNKKHKWVRGNQTRCVYTGSTAAAGGAAANFPTNLPTVSIAVSVIPTVVDDQWTVAAGDTLNVGGAGVLANDTGDGLQANVVAPPAHGSLTLNHNGSLRYVPVAGFSGTDHFTYEATNSSGESSGAATVTIHVTPVAAAVGSYGVAANATLNVSAPGLLAGALGSGLQAVLVSAPAAGTLTINADGSFSFQAPNGSTDSVSFSFKLVDSSGQSSGVVTVTIFVGAAPPSLVTQSFSGVVANTALQVGGPHAPGLVAEVYQGSGNLLAGDGDPSGGNLTSSAGTIATAQGGSVTIAADGTFTYQPRTGFTGPSDSFTYQVNTSEGNSGQATATIGFTGSRVWYVNGAASGGGDGSSSAPFNSLGALSGAAVLAPGDQLFVYSGSYDGGLVLGANETLAGQSVGLTVGSATLVSASGANPVITNSASSGVGITVSDGDSLSGVTVNGTAGAGIATASGANSFTIDSTVLITGAGADGLDVNGGTAGSATVAATISGAAGHSVMVAGRSGGTLTLSGPLSDHGTGLLLNNDGGATIAFTGAITASTATHPAFTATGGGTISATSPASTLATTTATALDVASGTTIANAGLTFQSISAGTAGSGPASGVILSDTGSAGGLMVLGNGTTAGSGGLIEHTSGVAGVSLTNTGVVDLNEIDLTANAGAGVDAFDVSPLTLSELQVTGSGTQGILVDGGPASSIQQLFDIHDNTLTGQGASAISLTYAGDASGHINNNSIGTSGQAGSGSQTGDGITVVANAGTDKVLLEVAGNTVNEVAAGDGISVRAPGAGAVDLTLTDNTVSMDVSSSHNAVQVSSGVGGGSGSVCVNPNGNVLTALGSGSGLWLEQLAVASTFAIEGYGGAATDTTAIESFLSGQNTLSGGGGGAVAQPDGSNGFTARTCDTPTQSNV
jgi:Bacterial Ig domain